MNRHHFGTYNPAAAAAAAGYNQHQQYQQSQTAPPPGITSHTLRDVLNGRGQGVQRHPGNVKYRTLVFVNKGLYAKCPRTDKIKISKGIVAAVRELGGRFLELEERTGIYRDIGDKKATEKTSQALREGQTKIRKQMYSDEKKAGGAQTYDMSILASSHTAAAAPASNMANGGSREISGEGYFGYSVQVLESLYREDENALHGPEPTSVQPQPAKPKAAPSPVQSGDANAAAIARALEQFPVMAMSMPSLPPPKAQATKTMQQPLVPQLPQSIPMEHNNQDRESELRPSMGRFTNELVRPSHGRLTNMSMASILSLTQLLEKAHKEPNLQAQGRGSVHSELSDEILTLFRQSGPQLVQVESMNNDNQITHVDKEVNVLFGEDTMNDDRVSALRFTDVGIDAGIDAGAEGIDGGIDAGGGSQHPRLTDYSGISLMDASMMTIGTEDMSVQLQSSKGKSDDRETADLLLRLSDENHGRV